MARFLDDLDVYEGCNDEMMIGMSPLGVGFLVPGFLFAKGATTANFHEHLRRFCLRENSVCRQSLDLPCAVCRRRISLDGERLGGAELRAIGDDDLFAAPDLIYHYVVEHQYLPPQPFIKAIVEGPQPGTDEHLALINALG